MRIVVRTALLAILLSVALVGCQHLRMSRGPDLAYPPDGTLRLASFNVHYILANQARGRWGLDGWERRRGPLDAAFKALSADVVAFQEMESFAGGNADTNNLARTWLLRNNPGYAAAAIGDWRTFPSTQPVFYRTDRLDLLEQGWFFFSDTPDVIYSRTFDGSYPAFGSWARLREKFDGQTFRVVNVHLDYASDTNRRRSTALIVEHLEPWIRDGETVFLVGDLNARLGSSLHVALEAAGVTFADVRGATYHFDIGLNLVPAIDHVAYAGAADPAGPAMVLREKFGPVWPSDHYPLAVDFTFAPR